MIYFITPSCHPIPTYHSQIFNRANVLSNIDRNPLLAGSVAIIAAGEDQMQMHETHAAGINLHLHKLLELLLPLLHSAIIHLPTVSLLQAHVREHAQEQQVHLLLRLSLLPKCAHSLEGSQEQAVDIFLSVLLLEHQGDQHEGGKTGDPSG